MGKGKVVVDTAQSSNPIQDTDDPIYPPGFTLYHMNIPQSQTTQHYVPMNPLYVVPPIVPNIEHLEARAKIQDMGQNKNTPAKQKLDVLEKRLRTIEGTDVYGNIDATQLCLVPGLIIPAKLKVPKFDKYDGSTFPRSHIIMYCRKMATHINNDRLLVHCFQDSLTGLANRLDLQRMKKKSSKSFNEYAQRWRDMTAEVQPPLTDKEMTSMFMNTLRAPFYERMIGNASTNFSDIIVNGERIEYGIKHGRLIEPTTEYGGIKKGTISKKKEGEVHAIGFPNSGKHKSIFAYTVSKTPKPVNSNSPRPFVQGQAPIPMIPIQPPYPKCFKKSGEKPNVNENPLPDHENPKVNAVDGLVEKCKNEVHEIVMPMEELFEGLFEARYVSHEYLDPNIRYEGIQVSSPFKFKDLKAVPWWYDFQVITGPSVDNVTGISGITRSGRCYKPNNLTVPSDGLILEQSRKHEKRNVKEHCKDQDVEMSIIAKDIEYKKLVTDDEANEFLKIVKQKPRRKVLLDILNKAHVGHDISVEKFSGIIGNITSSNSIVFTDEEISTECLGHTKALHIQVKCKDYVIARVLVDNGSTLNIMPKSTLLKLPVDMSHIKSSTMIVKAFNGSRIEVMGDIKLLVKIGPCIFNVVFQVMEITPAYNFLLGRPWIHSVGLVPSTLHQNLKFIVGSKLICVMGEEDFLITKPVSTPYVEATEEALECSFRSFEIAHATMMEATVDEVIKPHKSIVEVMTARIMGGGGYSLNQNLETLLKTPSNDGRSTYIFKRFSRSKPFFIDNIHKNEDVSNFSSTLDALIYTMESDKESDDEDDVGISSELLRMVEEEDEVLGPHKELVEAMNLGSQEESKERAMVTLFHDMMHKEIEVSVDDMIAKSKADEDHTTTL
ncbi:uncharacterized protein E5676_scaffold284G00970 [Cucumis melo var. makuwa]|uniref:Gag-pro-like protein n=1 Tax=Cucumis melo var. makuwa TaxID=1194695 RepID=A0A5D3DCC9_CUCMM|nr:uncharacterized protein E5676_scaffold284G00970 [Cucumis melo var. makuwa]